MRFCSSSEMIGVRLGRGSALIGLDLDEDRVVAVAVVELVAMVAWPLS